MQSLIIPKLFIKSVNKFSDRKSLGQKENGEYHFISYKELAEQINYFSSALLRLGINTGDKVALMSENCREWVISDLAIIGTGAVNVPVYPTLTHEQLEYILNDCGAKGIIISNRIHYNKILKILKNLKSLEFIIHIKNNSQKTYNLKSDITLKTLSFEEALKIGEASSG